MQMLDNTKAILLLTAPLLFGKNKDSVQPLTNKEYHQFALYLKHIHKEPADLLTSDLDNILDAYAKLKHARISQLLNRGFLLAQVLDYWHSRNIWVISRADKHYPSRLKRRLGENAPPILYGCGNIQLLNLGGLAIVGSRHIDDELIAYTKNVAQLSAKAGKMVISGGAKGADLSAMQGALNAGGTVCGVLANNLEKAALNSENRLALQENRLVLISAADPKIGFLVGNAMARNKYIYAFSDAGLVINSDLNKGGTWAGAVEQLEKYRQIPIYLRSTGEISAGLNALKNKGALWWDNPNNSQDLLRILNIEQPSHYPVTEFQENVFSGNQLENSALTPDQELFLLVKKLIEQSLHEPKKEQELAELLGVSSSQLKIWLKRLIDENIVVKQGKPIQYVLRSNSQSLALFS